MISRLVDWLDAQSPQRRRLYSLFLAILLLTLPCYAAGLFLLYFGAPMAPRDGIPLDTPPAWSTVQVPPSTMPTTTEVPREGPPAEEPASPVPATPMRTLPPQPTILIVTATPGTVEPTITTPPTLALISPTPPPATTELPATAAPTTAAPPTGEPATPEPPATDPPGPTDTPAAAP